MKRQKLCLNYGTTNFTKIDMQLVLIFAKIYYRLPDNPSILQEFIWQDFDRPPLYPRFKKLINYWNEHIEGPIASIDFCSSHLRSPDYIFADCDFTIH